MENLLSEVILDSSEDENSDVERCRGPVKRPAEDSEDEETIQKCVSCKQETDTFVHVTCLHFFCSECYKQLFSDPSGQPICPEDGKVIVPNFKAIKSVFAGEQALVPKMKIPCQNEERGCDKMIFFQDMSDHLSHCVFRLIPSCPYGCKDQVVFKDLTVHLDKLCKCRLVKCSFCCDDVPLNVLQKHEKKCPKKPVACPYCKTEGILFKELTDHVESCPMSPSVCVMRQMGCSFEGTKQTTDDHQQCWPSHIEVLVKCNISMQRQLNEMSARIDAMERSMGKEPTADVEISAAEPQEPLDECQDSNSTLIYEDGLYETSDLQDESVLVKESEMESSAAAYQQTDVLRESSPMRDYECSMELDTETEEENTFVIIEKTCSLSKESFENNHQARNRDLKDEEIYSPHSTYSPLDSDSQTEVQKIAPVDAESPLKSDQLENISSESLEDSFEAMCYLDLEDGEVDPEPKCTPQKKKRSSGVKSKRSSSIVLEEALSACTTTQQNKDSALIVHKDNLHSREDIQTPGFPDHNDNHREMNLNKEKTSCPRVVLNKLTDKDFEANQDKHHLPQKPVKSSNKALRSVLKIPSTLVRHEDMLKTCYSRRHVESPTNLSHPDLGTPSKSASEEGNSSAKKRYNRRASGNKCSRSSRHSHRLRSREMNTACSLSFDSERGSAADVPVFKRRKKESSNESKLSQIASNGSDDDDVEVIYVSSCPSGYTQATRSRWCCRRCRYENQLVTEYCSVCDLKREPFITF